MSIEKQMAIANAIIDAAMSVVSFAKDISKLTPTNKRRNVFVKSYNRRPANKKKRAVLTAQSAINVAMASDRIRAMLSQPQPKKEFLSGGIAVVGDIPHGADAAMQIARMKASPIINHRPGSNI